jgi:hypothetical protein
MHQKSLRAERNEVGHVGLAEEELSRDGNSTRYLPKKKKKRRGNIIDAVFLVQMIMCSGVYFIQPEWPERALDR